LHDILNQNLQYLKGRSQNLADRLSEISPDPSLELITAESGDWTARKYSWDGSYRFIHSRIDPRQEARMWTENQRIVMPRLVIIGVGLAYHVRELFNKCGNIEEAYLIEADESIFQLAMRVHDLESLIQNTSIHFLIGSPLSDIENDLVAAFVHPFSCHIFLSITSLRPDIYHPIIESVEKRLCALRLRAGDEETSIRGACSSFARGIENLLGQMSTT
jgi:hypothetical protein